MTSSTPPFSTAPRWYRPLLRAEDQLLYRLRAHLPTQAHLHGDDDATAAYIMNERLGIKAAERIVPGANASPYMAQHVGRYAWAMAAARGKRVLDLGCGDGYGSLLLSWTAAEVIGLDLSQKAVDEARTKYEGPDYRCADLSEPNTVPAGADLATCFEVLEHIPHPERVLQTASVRVPRLLLSVPNPLAGGSHINPHHINDWPLSKWKSEARRAGATSVTGYHQSLRGHRVTRTALPWHAFWLLDVRF